METIVNGRALGHYKDVDVRETGLAVPKAEPLYVPAISNGYAPDDFIVDDSLVFFAPLYSLRGSKFKTGGRVINTGTVTGALWRPNGRYFDAVNDKITFGSINLGTPSTLELWIKPAGTGSQSWTSAWELNRNALRYHNSRFFFGDIGGAYMQTTPGILIADVWQHIVGVDVDNNSDNALVYVDLTPYTQDGGIGGTFNLKWDDFQIGENFAGTQDYGGLIGEIRGYRRALSLADLTQNRNATIWRYQ